MTMKKLGLLAVPALLLAGCSLPGVHINIGDKSASPTPTPAAPSTPTAFYVDGTVSVPLSDYDTDDADGDDCTGADGYDDIDTGSQVEVQDESGTVLAVSTIEGGTTQDGRCQYTFTVHDIPKGHTFYAFQIGGEQRGSIKESADDLADNKIELTVG